jgi:hypothetical protein
MKIDKNYFAIKLLKGEDLPLRPPVEGIEYVDDIRRFATKLSKTPTKVYALSANFESSMLEASEKIMEAWHRDKINLEKPIQYCLLMSRGKIDVAYFIELKPVDGLLQGRIMTYNSDGHLDGFITLDAQSFGSDLGVGGFSTKSLYADNEEDRHGLFHAAWKAPLSCVLYMQYGEIETKLVSNKSREVFQSLTIENKSKQKVTALNSTWLNNLVKREGFKVSGHFRLQKVGVGRTETKLVWIENYEKNGYNRANDRWREIPTNLSD